MHDMCNSRVDSQIIYVVFSIVHSSMRLTALLSMAAKAAFPHDYRYGTNRPWTIAAKRFNPPGKRRRKVFVEPIANEEWHVLRGDTVSDPFCVYV